MQPAKPMIQPEVSSVWKLPGEHCLPGRLVPLSFSPSDRCRVAFDSVLRIKPTNQLCPGTELCRRVKGSAPAPGAAAAALINTARSPKRVPGRRSPAVHERRTASNCAQSAGWWRSEDRGRPQSGHKRTPPGRPSGPSV